MQRIMEDMTLDKLIEMRKCLRTALAETNLKLPNSHLEKHLKQCLKLLEQVVIKGIRDSNPAIGDDGNDC